MPNTFKVGQKFENEAAKWFLSHHCAVLIASHYFWRGGEIDLVFEEKNEIGMVELVFVEVRGKQEPTAEFPIQLIETIRPAKIRRLKRTISRFLGCYRGSAQTVRMDFLLWSREKWKHYPNVWI